MLVITEHLHELASVLAPQFHFQAAIDETEVARGALHIRGVDAHGVLPP